MRDADSNHVGTSEPMRQQELKMDSHNKKITQICMPQRKYKSQHVKKHQILRKTGAGAGDKGGRAGGDAGEAQKRRL